MTLSLIEITKYDHDCGILLNGHLILSSDPIDYNDVVESAEKLAFALGEDLKRIDYEPNDSGWSWDDVIQDLEGNTQTPSGGDLNNLRSIEADKAFATYDFGDESVKGDSQWSADSDRWTKTVFLEGADSESIKDVFCVYFSSNSANVELSELMSYSR